jgi:hypothetical protein
MNPTFSTPRRQLLATAAGTLLAPQLLAARTHNDKPLIVRQLACWHQDSQDLKCWFEGLAADVPLAVDDAQSIWSDRALDPQLDFQDLESLLFRNPTRQGLPTMRVGCATSFHLCEAVETAYIRAGGRTICDTGIYECAGWVLVSAPEHLLAESRSGIRSWAIQHEPYNAYFDFEALIDHSLERANIRVTVLIAV